MIALLLFVGLWAWDMTPDADGYRLYWSPTPWIWDRSDSVQIPGGSTTTYDDAPIAHLTTPQPGGITYITVVAYNATGEGPTGHGDVLPFPAGVCLP